MKLPAAWRRRLGNAAALFASLAVCLLLLEAAARWAFDMAPAPSYAVMADPHYLFSLTPNTYGNWKMGPEDGEKETVWYHVGPQGLRDRSYGPKPDGAVRVLCIGDSFTMGHGLANRCDTYPAQLERLLRERFPGRIIEVINAGVAGWGVWQELAWLKREGFDFEPDLVVLQAYAGNDVRDSLVKVGKRLKYDNGYWLALMDRYRVETRPLRRLDRWLGRRSAAYWRLSQSLWPLGPVTAYDIPDARRFTFEVMLKDYYPALEEGWRLTKRDIQAMARECGARGVPFCVLNTVPPFSVSPTFFDVLGKGAGQDIYELGKGCRLLSKFLEEAGIPEIELLPAFRSAEDVDRLFIANDGHWSPAGCRFVAQLAAPAVARQLEPRLTPSVR